MRDSISARTSGRTGTVRRVAQAALLGSLPYRYVQGALDDTMLRVTSTACLAVASRYPSAWRPLLELQAAQRPEPTQAIAPSDSLRSAW